MQPTRQWPGSWQRPTRPGQATGGYKSTWLVGPGKDSRPAPAAAETAELNRQAHAADAAMARELAAPHETRPGNWRIQVDMAGRTRQGQPAGPRGSGDGRTEPAGACSRRGNGPGAGSAPRP